jgi:predicted nucleic acid-binding protein
MKILLDADASIKLTKIGLIEILASEFILIMTDVVYDEHVNIGMKNNYPDAAIMKELVSQGAITVGRTENGYSSINSDFNLDRGEASLLNYYVHNEVDLIVSDDEKFLKALNELDFPFVPSACTILMCINRNLISKDEGLKFPDKLKFMIRDKHFYYIRNKIKCDDDYLYRYPPGNREHTGQACP